MHDSSQSDSNVENDILITLTRDCLSKVMEINSLLDECDRYVDQQTREVGVNLGKMRISNTKLQGRLETALDGDSLPCRDSTLLQSGLVDLEDKIMNLESVIVGLQQKKAPTTIFSQRQCECAGATSDAADVEVEAGTAPGGEPT